MGYFIIASKKFTAKSVGEIVLKSISIWQAFGTVNGKNIVAPFSPDMV